jgi:hypothetical protein
MKQLIGSICLLALLVFSCNREDPVPPPLLPTADSIAFTDIVPDQEIQQVLFFTFQDRSICTAWVPTPSDTSITFEFDLNQDQVFDFRLTVAHSEYTANYCGHCSKFTYSILVQGLSAGDSVAVFEPFSPIHRPFSLADPIDANNYWNNQATILLQEGCSLPFQLDFQDGYLGLKKGNSFGYLHIEKLADYGIRILDYGFNHTAGNDIACGQQ